MNIDYKIIGTRIKAARKECHMTQEILAEHLDVTIGYISQVERGITKISLDLLAKIATVLNADISELISGSAYHSSDYLNNEYMAQYATLTSKEKKLVLDFIQILINNRT